MDLDTRLSTAHDAIASALRTLPSCPESTMANEIASLREALVLIAGEPDGDQRVTIVERVACSHAQLRHLEEWAERPSAALTFARADLHVALQFLVA